MDGVQRLHREAKDQLLRWFDKRKRDLPWRRMSDPYAIWISEVMLQQTQVATVLPYFNRWMERFPTVDSLAAADEQEVLAAWQGLGYYRRCRYLLKGARHVLEEGLPTTAADWLRVPGVGPYTAGAVASIAFGEPTPLVDGNVERVYARLSADTSLRPKLGRCAWKWAAANVESNRPGDWNQALMELGATVCRPTEPLCCECPLERFCLARELGREGNLPKVSPSPKVKHLMHHVWVPLHEGYLGVRQIPQGEWWQGMWEFPRDTNPALLQEQLGDGCLEHLGLVRHMVTHHRITVEASLLRCDSRSANLHWMRPLEFGDLPMPAPQRRILKLVYPLVA